MGWWEEGERIRTANVKLSLFCRPNDERGRTVVEKSQHIRRVLPFVFNFEFPAFRDTCRTRNIGYNYRSRARHGLLAHRYARNAFLVALPRPLRLVVRLVWSCARCTPKVLTGFRISAVCRVQKLPVHVTAVPGLTEGDRNTPRLKRICTSFERPACPCPERTTR